MFHVYRYPRPAVSVDIILSSGTEKERKLLLVKRKNEPFKGMWALPGGFVNMDEDLHEAAARELYEETGLKVSKLQQFRSYGKPGRDPRFRTISIIFFCHLEEEQIPEAGDDAADAGWFKTDSLPPLGFDHSHIIKEFSSVSLDS